MDRRRGISESLDGSYQRLLYIETTGTQYINTGVIPSTNDYSIETTVVVNTTKMDLPIIGTNNGSTYYHITPYSNAFYYGNNGSESHAGTYANVIGTTYNVIYNKNGKVYVNGTEVGTTNPTSSTSICISRRSSLYASFKYYYLIIKKDNSIIRNFIPLLRYSDSKPGFYDTISKTFFTNAGTGEFLYG